MQCRFVLLHHRLNAPLRISSRAHQILLGILNLILVQFQLRFCNFQFVGDRQFPFAFRFQFLRGQSRDLRFIVLQRGFRFHQVGLQFSSFRPQNRRVFRRAPQCRSKCQVHFVIRQPQRFLRQRVFIFPAGQQGQALRCSQRGLIDDTILCVGIFITRTC